MFDQWIHDLNRLIDRHFAAHRVLLVEREGSNWTASIGDDVLYRSPDGGATLRFARTFADRTPGVTVEVEEGHGQALAFAVDLNDRHSVRVPSLQVVK